MSAALDGARASARELASRHAKLRGSPNTTAKLAEHVARVVLWELAAVHAFIADEVASHPRDEDKRAEQMHAAAVALGRVTIIVRDMNGGA